MKKNVWSKTNLNFFTLLFLATQIGSFSPCNLNIVQCFYNDFILKYICTFSRHCAGEEIWTFFLEKINLISILSAVPWTKVLILWLYVSSFFCKIFFPFLVDWIFQFLENYFYKENILIRSMFASVIDFLMLLL